MADPSALVKMKLVFWHKDKKPGDIVEVRREDVRSWYGFAELVDDVEPAKADESADTGAQKTPDKADDAAPAPAKTAAAKTSGAKA
ncbi:hypothetical protein [Streptomyces sp. NPDC001492]